MKLIFTCFIIVVFCLGIIECQLLTANEMLNALKTIPAAMKFNETKKCLPAIEGKLYPNQRYSFMACDTNQNVILLRNVPNETQCSGFQCWESQLTDSSRLDILEIMNTYRILIAQGTCGSRCEHNNHKIVFELRWSNLLEYLAIGYISNCKDQKNTSLTDSILYNNKSGRIDYVAVSFEVKKGFQREVRLILKELIAKNHLNDWDEKTKQFRRGLAIDVGCAYVLRYGVYMITSLNERVNFGNVGHLCCVFGSPKSSIALNNVNPSSSACSHSLPGFTVELSSKNSSYHFLCQVAFSSDRIKTPSFSCQFDRKIHDEIFDNICPASSSQNYVTWSEKPYGFFLKFRTKQNDSNQVTSVLQDVDCNLPNFLDTLQHEVKNEHNHTSSCKQEVVNEANTSACQGWFCNESQLSNESRHLIKHSVNTARNLVARGICTTSCKPPCMCNGIEYCNVVEIHWHWYLELKAIERIKNCPNENSHQRVFYFDSPFFEPVYFEEVILVFDLPPEGQIKLADMFTEFFWTNTLNDWKPDGIFRRGNAMWMGCAIVVRPSQIIVNMRPELKIKNGLPTHMVCIYALLNEDLDSIDTPPNKNCFPACSTEAQKASSFRFKMEKNSSLHPYLCSFHSSPETTMSCATNKCKTVTTTSPSSEPILEKYAVIGYALRQYSSDFLDYENKIFYEKKLKYTYMAKICNVGSALFCMITVLLILVTSLIYKHNMEKKYRAKMKK